MPIDSAARQGGQRLRELRELAGYGSQRAFAKALDVSSGLVAQWESGRKFPGRKNLRKIAEKTGVPIDYILDPTEALPPVTDSQPLREEELLRIFRALPVTAQKNLVQLLRQMLVVGRELNHNGQPA